MCTGDERVSWAIRSGEGKTGIAQLSRDSLCMHTAIFGTRPLARTQWHRCARTHMKWALAVSLALLPLVFFFFFRAQFQSCILIRPASSVFLGVS